jgi:hypothetical protein
MPEAYTYTDFELEIITNRTNVSSPHHTNKYQVLARVEGGGEGHAEITLSLQNLEELKDQHTALRETLLDRNDNATRQFGQKLFDTFCVGQIRDLYIGTLRTLGPKRGLRLKLHIADPSLASLPWEFLYDTTRSRFVSLKNDSIVRYQDQPWPVETLIVEPPLQILGMTASPAGWAKLDTSKEQTLIETALQDLIAAEQVNLNWVEGQTWRDLKKAMRQKTWHVFHFIGHGYVDLESHEGMLALCDEAGNEYPLSATNLSNLFAAEPPRLVVLNACEGAAAEENDVFSSLAAILNQQGIPAVLAMQYAISDNAAIEMSRSFYESLAQSQTLSTAIIETRQNIKLETQSSEWGTPALYTRSPDAVLFNVVSANQAKPAVSVPPPTTTSNNTNQTVFTASTPTPSNTNSNVAPLGRKELRKLIIQKFSLAEFKLLAADAGRGYDLLEGDSFETKVLALISYYERKYQSTAELERQVREYEI